jgi:hypothetical protein
VGIQVRRAVSLGDCLVLLVGSILSEVAEWTSPRSRAIGLFRFCPLGVPILMGLVMFAGSEVGSKIL